MLIPRVSLKNYYGYSLIELIITITLTSIVMTIFYTVFSKNQVNSVTPVMQVKAAELGQAYLEEISLKRFDENSPIGNATPCVITGTSCTTSGNFGPDTETRSTFDDVDDYHGLTNTPPEDALGNQRSGFNGFTVDIEVTYVGTLWGLPNNEDLKKIEVSVTLPTAIGDVFIFTQYRGNF